MVLVKEPTMISLQSLRQKLSKLSDEKVVILILINSSQAS